MPLLDLSIISDFALIGEDGKIHGVPDLCVEVLSPSTAKNDLGKKMELYARNGVKEYWTVNPRSKEIYVYKLNGDHYELDEIYFSCTQKELDALTDEERAEVKDKIQVGIFPDLLIDVDSIFDLWFN